MEILLSQTEEKAKSNVEKNPCRHFAPAGAAVSGSGWERKPLSSRTLGSAVCYAALIVIPPLVRMFGMGLAPEWETWIYRALTFLVASCPCALVISIPLSFFAGIGGASKAGVQKTVMHTGDAKKVADKVAADLGVDQVYSELLPADKVEKVEELLGTKPEKSTVREIIISYTLHRYHSKPHEGSHIQNPYRAGQRL